MCTGPPEPQVRFWEIVAGNREPTMRGPGCRFRVILAIAVILTPVRGLPSCHRLRAMDEAAPKILIDLGLAEAPAPPAKK